MRGFTLVEVVLTLLLVSIISVLGIGLFASKDSYTNRTVADQILSQARLAQQVALGRSIDTTTSFTVTKTSDAILLRIEQGSYQEERTLDGISGNSIFWKDSGTTSCGGGSSSNFTLTFNREGDATSPGGNATNTLICISGSQTIPICISPLGFAYEGVCDS